MELSSFLKELSCPYPALISGPISERFQLSEHRTLLLNYLTTELMAAKMCQKLNPQKQVIIEIVSEKKNDARNINTTKFGHLKMFVQF